MTTALKEIIRLQEKLAQARHRNELLTRKLERRDRRIQKLYAQLRRTLEAK